MALETGSFIHELNSSNPQSTDSVSQADDHLRLLKATIKATFPNITGAVTKTHSQINDLLEKAGGTMTGPLTLNGAPSSNLHAATKLYVDTADAAKANASTTVTAGTGLTGGGDLSTNRTLSVASGGIGTTELANSAVTSTKLASGAAVANIGFTPVNPSEFTGANQSKSTSGYQKLPGGIIIQWGRATSLANGNGVATVTDNFPIAFTTCYVFTATPYSNTLSLDGDWGTVFTNTGYGARHRTNSSLSYSWIAIGV